MTNDNGNVNDLIQYRLERAKETLEEAKILIDKGGKYNGAVNRMYYACLYAAIALLASKGISAEGHNGIRTMLGMHFVKTGILNIEMARLYGQLSNARISGDYDLFITFQEDKIKDFYAGAQKFIQTVKNILNSFEPLTSQ